MVKAEQAILGRSTDELTSYAGYAGAKSVGSDGKLCYHNIRGTSDYGKAGAGEVGPVLLLVVMSDDCLSATLCVCMADGLLYESGTCSPQHSVILVAATLATVVALDAVAHRSRHYQLGLGSG